MSDPKGGTARCVHGVLLWLHPGCLDVDRLARALAVAEVNCWANTTAGHKITDPDDGTAAHRQDAIAIAREYAALAVPGEEKA